jgi:hypothetical protein
LAAALTDRQEKMVAGRGGRDERLWRWVISFSNVMETLEAAEECVTLLADAIQKLIAPFMPTITTSLADV